MPPDIATYPLGVGHLQEGKNWFLGRKRILAVTVVRDPPGGKPASSVQLRPAKSYSTL